MKTKKYNPEDIVDAATFVECTMTESGDRNYWKWRCAKCRCVVASRVQNSYVSNDVPAVEVPSTCPYCHRVIINQNM